MFTFKLNHKRSFKFILKFNMKAQFSILPKNIFEESMTDSTTDYVISQTDPYQVSFHIPLHRYLAAFTCQAVRAQGIPLKEILPSNSLLQLIMMHPLRIQVPHLPYT